MLRQSSAGQDHGRRRNIRRRRIGASLERLEARRLLDSTVVFSELMYNPAGSDEGAEWIELQNQMSVEMDVSGWRIRGGVAFDFPDQARIPPGGIVLIAQQPDRFANVGDAAVWGPFEGRLANEGESIELVNANGRLMDLVDYDDRGSWPIGPDGSGSSLAKIQLLRGSAAVNWSTSSSLGGTPGYDNGPVEEAAVSGLRFNEIAAASTEAFWVELQNTSLSSVDASKYRLLVSGAGVDRSIELPDVVVPAGGWIVLDASQFRSAVAQDERLFLVDQPASAVVDAFRVDNRLIGRSKDDAGHWWFPSTPSPAGENIFAFQSGVVINELLYHHAPVYATADHAYAENSLEWIELFNATASDVDMSRWSFRQGIELEFEPGTTLGAGQYAILTNDQRAFLEEYPDVAAPVVHQYVGQLSNQGEAIELVDQLGNVVDRVHYSDDGRWPAQADGGGSSLELIDSRSDNSVAESWAASWEGSKSEWQSIRYRAEAREPLGAQNPRNGFNELILGLLDAGQILIDDLSVVEDPDGAAVELLTNGTFDADVLGQAATSWRFVGNHAQSAVVADPDDPSNTVLQITASGATEHMSNHLETTFQNDRSLDRNAEVQISFRARWLSGSPQLNTRLYFNQAAETTVIDLPHRTGTPGAQNSYHLDNSGPTFSVFQHAPLIPQPDESVVVTTSAHDPDGVSQVWLHYAVNGGGFESVEMQRTDDERYQASIPPQRTGQTVQFYVEAADARAATATFPAAGPSSRALFRVGSRDEPGDVRSLTLIMSRDDVRDLHANTNVMSNARMGATVIDDKQIVYYDVGARLRGSGYGRNDARAGFNISFPRDQQFRGVHSSIAIDRGVVLSPGTGQGPVQGIPGASPHELLIHHIANHAGGVAGMYDDVIYFDAPRSANAGISLLKMARYGNAYLDSQFANGSDGSLFELELIYYFNRATASDPERVKGSPNAVLDADIRSFGDDKDAYRWNYILKNNRDRDDFSQIIKMAQAVLLRDDELQTASEAVMDMDAWTRYVAFQALVGTADTFNQGLGHNLYLFVRPEDQRIIPMPWDVDHGFYHHPNGSLIGTSGSRFARLVREPRNERQVYKHLLDIIETTYNLDYLRPWISHYTALTRQSLESFFVDYVDARSQFVPQQIERIVPKVDFSVTTNDGRGFQTDQNQVALAGNGWVNIDHVSSSDGRLLELRWIDTELWEIDVAIRPGLNDLRWTAFDRQGRVVGEVAIDIVGQGQLEGDLDGDGQLTSRDIKQLCRSIAGSNLLDDLNRDGQVDRADVDYLIDQLMATSYGDANLDGRFDSNDLIGVFEQGQFEDGVPENSNWEDGDWDCDGDFTSADLILALATGKYSIE